MKTIGIIANAHSGKDIRRLVSSASVFEDREKINILKRLLLTLNAMKVDKVLIMPDTVGLARTAIRDTGPILDGLSISIVDLPFMEGDHRDSQRAARMMADEKCGCIITLGGDGTNRAVAAACNAMPMLPISAGTNNVFPYRVEATIAGMAAAAFAHEIDGIGRCLRQRPLLELYKHGRYADMALVDIVVVDQHYTGARAVWDPDLVRELFLTRARAGDIGLSSIGAALHPMPLDSGLGMHVRTGKQGDHIIVPIAPGLVHNVTISDYRLFGPGEAVSIISETGILALDGEREMNIDNDDRLTIKLNLQGPRVIDIEETLNCSIRAGFLRRSRNT